MLKQLFEQQSTKFQQIKEIYQLIHRIGPTTKSHLIKQTNIKQTTMVRHLEYLLEHNLIQIGQYDKSTGGRPPALYKINPTIHYLVGIDISRTHTRLTVVDLQFNRVDGYAFTMTREHTPERTIAIVSEKIQDIFHERKIEQSQLLGIGIGAVGPLDRKNGVILEPEAFPADGWKQVNIVEMVKKSYPGLQVFLENGANTAALGEYYYSAKQHENVLYCISGIGLRCGVLANGRFVQNSTGDASAFGQMIIQVLDEGAQKNNTLSSFISLDSILEEIYERIKAREKTILTKLVGEEYLSIDHIFEGMRKGDALVEEIVMKSAYYYGIGLANMINVLHPDQVILSSKLIYEFPIYFDKIVETAKQFIYRYDRAEVVFYKGNLKEDAVSVGAAMLVFDSYFHTN